MLRSIFLLLAMVAGGINAAYAGDTVSLMANTSPPYADKKLPEQGLAPELVKLVFARTGYTPEIAIENWSRAVEGAELGVYEGLAAAWYSDQRNETLMFSEPYLRSELIILKLRSNQGNYRTLEQLAGGRLGVRVDYAYGIDFGAIERLQLVEENHLIQNLLNLLNGSVDFVIGDRRTIVMQLHEYLAGEINKFEVLKMDLPGVERHVAISRSLAGHEKIIEDFNRALAAARQDGSLDAVINKWDEQLGKVD